MVVVDKLFGFFVHVELGDCRDDQRQDHGGRDDEEDVGEGRDDVVFVDKLCRGGGDAGEQQICDVEDQ